MRDKIKTYTLEILAFAAKKVLLFDVILCLVVALSFLLIGKFSIQAYGERLIWTGIGVALVAGILVSSQTVGGRDFGVPGMFVRTAHAQNLIDFNIEVRQAITQRMGLFPRLFLIGAVLFGLGALIQVLSG